jgi:hypothetical protein
MATDAHPQFLISPLIAREKSQRVTDAFKKGMGGWIPAMRNFQEKEKKNLSAAQGTTITAEDTLGNYGSPLLPDGFPLAVSDRLLAMLVSVSELKDNLRVPPAFPSCEALARLFRSFMAWHANQDDTWIHVLTFSLEEVSVELVVVIVAGGALRSPNRPFQKFGLPIHELMSIWIWQTVRETGI